MTQLPKELQDEEMILIPVIMRVLRLYLNYLNRFCAFEFQDKDVEPIDNNTKLELMSYA